MAVRTTYASLYTGGGGLDLGFELGLRGAVPVLRVERDAAAAAVLVSHMETGRLAPCPLWSDSGTLDGKPWRGLVDWIIGGFPCQPWSVAGAQEGTEDDRWLWPHIRQLARDMEPRGLFMENVPGLFLGGIQPVLGELAEDGYDTIWTTIRASDVGASHRRQRVFILAYRDQQLRQVGIEEVRPGWDAFVSGGRDVGDTDVSSGDAQPTTGRPRHSAGEPGGQLADAHSEPGDLQQRSSGVSEPRGSIRAVAQPDSSRRTPAGCGVDVHAGSQPEERGDRVAVTGHGRGWQDDEGVSASGRERAGEPVGDVGDTDHCTGIDVCGESRHEDGERQGESDSGNSSRQGVGDTDQQGPQGRGEPERERGYKLPAWPPGPADRDAWAYILERWPELAPAVEPTLRGVVNGDGDGLARSDQLRILGNGVVPLQAAVAFRTLVTQARRL